MDSGKTWTCEGCGHKQDLRKIDAHRWVTSQIGAAGERLEEPRTLELCPTCQARLMGLQVPEP